VAELARPAGGGFAVYARLVSAGLRGRVYRPGWLLIRMIGSGLIILADGFAAALVVDRFGTLAGWSAPEVVLLVGLSAAGQGLGLLLGDRLEPTYFSELVRRGTFDQVLVRPASPLAWLIATQVEARFVGRLLAGVGMVAWAADRAGVTWTSSHLLVALLALVCCATLVLSVCVLGAALTFATVEGSEVVNIFVYGGVTLTGYPVQIYGSVLRFLFVWVVPFALAVYVPALVLLGRTGPPGLPAALVWVTPVATVGFTALAALGWRHGLRHYVGAGS
jgi:viologen exporter family transport system permease protein